MLKRTLEHTGDVAAVGPRVHPHASADRAGDRAGELEVAEVGRAGSVEAHRKRRATPGDQAAVLDRRGRKRARRTGEILATTAVMLGEKGLAERVVNLI